jgi:hypothetical protein
MKKYAALLTVSILITINAISVFAVNSNDDINNDYNINQSIRHIKTDFLTRLINIKNEFARRFGFLSNYDLLDLDFNPEDITLKDDAYHGSDSLHYTEWWYFDVAFDNGYSAQMSVRILDIFNKGLFFVFSRLDVYKNGDLYSHNIKTYYIDDFQASEYVPNVILDGQQVINGYIDESTGNWIYEVYFCIDGTTADLTFIGTTQGWKGEVPAGKWVVALPRADVTGKIILDYKDIYYLNGVGYHDHNWDVTYEAAFNLGWLWGKINSGNYTITWADIITLWFYEQPLAIINVVGEGYVNILSENIIFSQDELRFYKGEFIPTLLTISAQQDNITFNIQMKIVDIHHEKVMGIVDYWRYHVNCKGWITIKDKTEEINDFHMAELVRFY